MSVRALEDEIKKLYPKESKEEKEEVSEEVTPRTIFPTTASSTDFVNSSPLVPTAELPKDESNYGKVTIAPPEGGDMPNTPIINYGEIDKDDDKEPLPIPNETTSVDINEVKEKSSDLQSADGGNALDSLLNLGNPTSSVPANEFITPAEKIVKTDSMDDEEEKTSDYFNTSDLSSIELPPSIINPVEDEGNMTVEDASKKIKDLVEDIKSKGLTITADEMDFEKSYQIIIKIDKNDNKAD